MMTINACRRLLLGLAAVALFTNVPAQAQMDIDFDQVTIKTTKVADGIYMLEGAGGNLGLSTGKDGAFLIDDQFAPLTEKIAAAVAAVSDQPIKFVLNTHYHGDHTGGNENLGAAGAMIVAHDNVRTRLAEGLINALFNREIPPAPEGALPIITFSDEVTFHINGQTIHVFHVEPAHTDGDAIIHFTDAGVLHTGDVFQTSGFPIIDTAAGGTFAGTLKGYERILAVADADTKIIPGHGGLTDRAQVAMQYEMLTTIRDRIATAKAQGQSLDTIKAAKPTAEYDERFGQSFITGDRLTEQVFNELP